MDAIADKRPRPIPASIGLFFGGLWCWLGASGLPAAWEAPVGIAGLLLSLVLIARLLLFVPSVIAGWFVSQEDVSYWIIAFAIALVFIVLTIAFELYVHPRLRARRKG